MQYTKIFGLFISLILGLVMANYQLNNYEVGDQYSIKFETGKAEGTFSGMTGEVIFNDDNLSGSIVNVTVDVNTIQTGNERKDDHAKGNKWFNANEYPTMTFLSSDIVNDGDSYIAKGQLTIKDVTREVEIPFDVYAQNSYLNGSFEVNRKDYNINGNLFGFAVGKNVNVTLNVPANYKK